MNKPIKEVTFEIKNLDQIDYLQKFLKIEGNTRVTFKLINKNNKHIFKLNKNRDISRQSINELKNKEILATIE